MTNRNSEKQASIMSKFLFILAVPLVITAVLLLSDVNMAPVRTLLYPVTGLAGVIGNENTIEEQSQNLPVEESPAEKAEKIINSMSPEQMAGQLMMVGFNGLEPDYYISRMINLRNIGGVILFGRNIESPYQVAQMNNQLQSMSLANKNLPLFIAVDQEGGKISRFEDVITSFPGPALLGMLGSPDAVELVAADTAEELAAMGVNVNLAPVMDVGRRDSVMAGRVFGNDPDHVAELGVAAVNGYRKGGLISCVKHFPGLGRSILDTHDGQVEINADLASLREVDMPPFRQAIDGNVEMLLVGHALYPALDEENPSTISYNVQTTLLREELGYSGLILSDDLEMGAVTVHDSVGRFAVKAIKAGTDVVLVCHTPEKQKEVYDSILEAITSGEISEQRLKESLTRIITLKLKYKIDQNNQVALPDGSSIINSEAHNKDASAIRQKIELLES